ncbi:DUF928 domain-containing protein [Roseofilum casamattae]|uniref:DUF928 domain-containing protein n=1 Tax=Roseofilum casamattae BLCC-M143 TaxID=3022442 RepID=A0ABT7BU08_9CYAN|nr:DUF928 domain-containing protein [Roseofilum casamattae]MDJ1182668.1 DUF928 domain-containing protein [Roseofilum casamattae BLCC-M143]
MSKSYSMPFLRRSCCVAVVGAASLLIPAIALSQPSIAQLPTDLQFEPPPGSGEPSETVGGGSRLLDRVLKIDFEPPPGQGAPGETLGGASRGLKCLPNETPVTVLVPQTPAGVKYGLTTIAKPSFFVYIPETVATEIEFIVTDNQPYPNGQVIDERVLPIPSKPGILQIDLQGDLDVDDYYEWAIYLRCPNSNPNEDPTLALPSSGWLKRVEVDNTIEERLQGSSVLERVIIYAQQGIWFDSLSLLSEQLQQAPTNLNLRATWSQFINSEIEELDEQVTRSPIIECCTP